ncbi:phosphatidylglycerol lysyltransferase domain-containing protein [Actinophytocola sp.]|uniref:phosphatidylglycerol lysyltransferase domain-containing protein n=1 Tax=Actinophytocola sp. TaxID=1872138 RepID=UPI002ED19CE2
MRNSWCVYNGRAVRVLATTARVAGLLAVLAVVLPVGRRLFRPSLATWFGLPYQAHVGALVVTAVAGLGLLTLATGLRRRKRRAWQLAMGLTGLIAVLQLVFRHAPAATLVAAGLFAALFAYRREFAARPDPATGRWLGVRVFAQIALGGVLVNFLIMLFARHRLIGSPSVTDRLEHAALSLVGVSGPVGFRVVFLDDLTSAIGIVSGVTAALLGGYFLLRSAEPAPAGWGDATLRRLLDGRDSLAYFALRPDKSVVFSPTEKAAVSYRVLAGVALASGDPLGDPEAWPGAITAFLETCAQHGWVPAVLGCSERGATVWSRHGLRALELGDEAVVDATTFTVEGRAMRDVRQLAARARRAGYEIRVRRTVEVSEVERLRLAALAEEWRGTEPERGFSMALCRTAAGDDPECVLVTAERDGECHGLLQFVPWGDDGLSLDVMRRDRTAQGGLNELMITTLLATCRDLGVHKVSLNFAVFRAALERGERIGAGPVARAWASLLRLGSRWWQIESLYRFNAKFQPAWVPRFIAFPAARELPRIALATMEAEGFGGRPRVLLRALQRV